jgi:hypothetical protein
MPDLSSISRNTLETQHRHEGFEPSIDWSRAVGFGTHFAFSRVMSSGVRVRQQRLLA